MADMMREKTVGELIAEANTEAKIMASLCGEELTEQELIDRASKFASIPPFMFEWVNASSK